MVFVSHFAIKSETAVFADSPVERLVAESINLDSDVVEMSWREVVRNGVTKRVWVIPDEKVGWHQDSKLPGQGGNIVLSGHNNSMGEVFRDIGELEQGDLITLYVQGQPYQYSVVQKLFLKDKGEPDSVRRENARWIGPINEERLTLVSDWPYTDSTHKVVIIAWPKDNNEAINDNNGNGQIDAHNLISNTPNIETVNTTEITQSNLPSLADDPLIAEIESPVLTETDEKDTLVRGSDLPITRLLAPSIGLNTSVIEVGWHQIMQDGVPKNVWQVADYAAGWHNNSKKPGQGGNIVLSGHHNINGQVFRYLANLNKGDLITVYQDNKPSYYAVTDKLTLKDKGEPPEVRRENARWIGPFDEERLTLVSCWPYNSNTHRLVVIAKPTDPPAEPLAMDPLSIEQRPSVIAMDTVPKPVSNLAIPAAVMPANQANNNTITRLVAESINLDTPIISEGWKVVERDGKPIKLWDIPENAAGWHQDSKLPQQGGNIVLSGFHNIKGEVFRYIVDLKPGDVLTLYMGDEPYRYKVVDRLILKDKGEPPEVRQQNARWIGQVNEERLTLVTGWPYTGNTHRVVVIARPMLEN